MMMMTTLTLMIDCDSYCLLMTCNKHSLVCYKLFILLLVFLISDYFKETSTEGKDAILSALQRLQRDPDRDVRYFAGVEEDALDLTFEGHASCMDTAQEHFQDISCSPEEECELENLIPDDGGNRVESLDEVVSRNAENRTETFHTNEQLEAFDQTTLEESSSSGDVFDTNLESAAHEFEEDERRLDLESQEETNQVETTSDEHDEAVKSDEETAPQCDEVLFSTVAQANTILC